MDASIATVENENCSSDRLTRARDFRRRHWYIFLTTSVVGSTIGTVVMTIYSGSQSSIITSSSSGDSCLKYQLIEVDSCGMHGGRVGCLWMVADWLRRAIFRYPEVSRPAQIPFPENLFVSVMHDRDVIVAVLKKSSTSPFPNSCSRGKLETSGCCRSKTS